MKKITVLFCLILFTGLTIIIPLFGMEITSCYAQVTQKKYKVDKEKIKQNLARLKDPSHAYWNNDPEERIQAFYAIPQWDLSETYNEVAETLADVLDNDTNDRVRAVAASLFFVVHDYRDSLDIKVIKSLEKALNDKAARVKLEAAGALVNLGYYKDNNAYSILEDFVRGKDKEKWNTEATKTSNPNELRLYSEELSKLQCRTRAIMYIAFDNTPKTEALLVEMTKDPEESVSGWAKAMLERRFIKK